MLFKTTPHKRLRNAINAVQHWTSHQSIGQVWLLVGLAFLALCGTALCDDLFGQASVVSVSRDRLMSRIAEPRLHLDSLAGKTATLNDLTLIDRYALGVSREKHHRYLIGDRATSGFTIHDGNECVGYVYISDGHIGPLAVSRPEVMGAALATALSFAARSNSPNISAFLPGASESALKAAMNHGMRITFPMLLMSTREFGNWVSYLPRNPGFM